MEMRGEDHSVHFQGRQLSGTVDLVLGPVSMGLVRSSVSPSVKRRGRGVPARAGVGLTGA